MLRILIACFLLFTCVGAQAQTAQTNVTTQDDTLEIAEGVIRVERPHIRPFVQVDYSLHLAKVSMMEVLVPAGNGVDSSVERDRQPFFDTTFYPKTLERVSPVATTHLSKVLAKNLFYTYSANDTPRIDTVTIGLWITKNGKIKQIFPVSEIPEGMSEILYEELCIGATHIAIWNRDNKGGGYMTRRRFLRPSEFVPENYYCVMRVVISSMPLTPEQVSTGVRYSNADAPR
ncbi:MAG: hypothetical protein ACRCYO_04615 [Bacteroidia bacterium]